MTDGPDNGTLVIDPTGLGSETNLTTDGAFDHHARWSPDGTQIAFTSERGAGGDQPQIPAVRNGVEGEKTACRVRNPEAVTGLELR